MSLNEGLRSDGELSGIGSGSGNGTAICLWGVREEMGVIRGATVLGTERERTLSGVWKMNGRDMYNQRDTRASEERKVVSRLKMQRVEVLLLLRVCLEKKVDA